MHSFIFVSVHPILAHQRIKLPHYFLDHSKADIAGLSDYLLDFDFGSVLECFDIDGHGVILNTLLLPLSTNSLLKYVYARINTPSGLLH